MRDPFTWTVARLAGEPMPHLSDLPGRVIAGRDSVDEEDHDEVDRPESRLVAYRIEALQRQHGIGPQKARKMFEAMLLGLAEGGR